MFHSVSSCHRHIAESKANDLLLIEKRYARKRDDARFRRETLQLRIAIATLVVAVLAVGATVVGILVTLATRG